MTEKLTISRETHELKILIHPRIAENAFCIECQSEVRWLIPEEAMILAGISLRKVFRLVEMRKLHFAENVDGFLIICNESLAAIERK
jgi:hypothetical protein